jgi:hypothetical protein
MPRAVAVFLVVFALLLPGCAEDTPQSLADEVIEIMEDLVDALASVTDRESAEAARDRIEQIAERLKDNILRRQAWDDPDGAMVAEFEAAALPRLEVIRDRVEEERARIKALGSAERIQIDIAMQSIYQMDLDEP